MSEHSLRIEADGATSIGRRRVRNEDTCGVFPEIGLFAVADGVATRPSGEIAPEMAIDLVRWFLQNEGPAGEPGALAVACARFMAAVRYANAWIRRSRQGQEPGMLTTFAGCEPPSTA